MAKQKDTDFATRLERAKSLIGREYVNLILKKYPHFSKAQLRNVANAGIEDWEILEAFEDIARTIQKYFVPKKQDVAC